MSNFDNHCSASPKRQSYHPFHIVQNGVQSWFWYRWNSERITRRQGRSKPKGGNPLGIWLLPRTCILPLRSINEQPHLSMSDAEETGVGTASCSASLLIAILAFPCAKIQWRFSGFPETPESSPFSLGGVNTHTRDPYLCHHETWPK